MYHLYTISEKYTRILYKDGSIIDGSQVYLHVDIEKNDGKCSCDGYDVARAYCYIDGYEANAPKVPIHVENIAKIYLDLYYPEWDVPTILAFNIKNEILHVNEAPQANIDLYPDQDTIEYVSAEWKSSKINEQSKSIEIYINILLK